MLKLRPSAAGQWVKCPASVLMQEKFGLRAENREAADEGIEAHRIAAVAITEALRGREVATVDTHVNVYVRYAVPLLKTINNDSAARGVEEKLDCGSISDGMCGICDAYVISGNTLHVIDFKYGRAIVAANENAQLLIYAQALLIRCANYVRDVNAINLYIIQPRSIDGVTIKTWELSRGQLPTYIFKIKTAAASARSDKPLMCVGSQCRYCTARASCPVLQQSAMQCAENLELQELPEILSEQQLNNELLYLEEAQHILTDRITALEALAVDRIKKGKHLSDFALTPSYSHAQWQCGLEDVIALGKIYGLDLLKPAEAITPTQAKKFKEIKEIVDAMSERKQLGFKLTKDTKIKEVFKNDTK
jgi:hypothetical protein